MNFPFIFLVLLLCAGLVAGVDINTTEQLVGGNITRFLQIENEPFEEFFFGLYFVGNSTSKYFDPCSQESTNVTTSCGGLSTGNYTPFNNSYNQWVNIKNFYDGDWSTFANSTCTDDDRSPPRIRSKYMFPDGIKPRDIAWEVRDQNGFRNLTPSDACFWNSSYIEFVTIPDCRVNRVRWACCNQINCDGYTTLNWSNGVTAVYEEAIHWNYTPYSSPVNISVAGNVEWASNVTHVPFTLTHDMSASVNAIDSASCSCPECFSLGGSCYAPILFEFNRSFNLTYNLTDTLFVYVGGSTVLVTVPEYHDSSWSDGIPPLEELWDEVRSGGSLGGVLSTWNPSAAHCVETRFMVLLKGETIHELPNNIWQFLVCLIKYIFREPASLVAVGGAS
jgi:hypothetical protein